MNTTMAILFHLDISLEHLAKLRTNYFYIPENKVHRLRAGGFVYVVERGGGGGGGASLRYLGILVAATPLELTFFNNDKVAHATVHVFYRPPPQSAKTKRIMSLLKHA
jgi:hypothetical protein